MVVTHVFKETSKQAQYIKHDAIMYSHIDIYDAYATPSRNKVNAFNALKNEYMFNDTTVLGIPCKTVRMPNNVIKYLVYKGDISVVAHSSHFFTTIATFDDVETGDIWAIKETHCNTYAVKMWGLLW